jgi:hypothetical protein
MPANDEMFCLPASGSREWKCQQETQHEVSDRIVVAAPQMKMIAYPVEGSSFCVGEVTSPLLHEQVKEDHVVGESRIPVIALRDNYCG